MVTGTSRSGVMAQVRTKPVQDTMSNVDSVMHEVGCTEIQFVGFHPLKTNLEKDSPYVRTTCVRWESKSSSYSPGDSRAACRHGEGPCRVPNFHVTLQSLPNGP